MARHSMQVKINFTHTGLRFMPALFFALSHCLRYTLKICYHTSQKTKAKWLLTTA